MNGEILAVVTPSPVRRWMGVLMQSLIGMISIYVAFASPPEPKWQFALIVIGGAAFWSARKMQRATGQSLELTETELRSSEGETIAKVSEVEAIDRGFLAFKPSNGFLITLKSPGQRRWQPGLWWCLGRRIGIGGVVPGHQSRVMADLLAAMIADRK
ncbi:hypothetical protein [Phaeobacter sp. 22II1-1F12B]|uniref:hypothetical protein n=1 Tax=Phaeobacter sp. 22II1-1F12B TaxID=1317111 RepID=UPI000B51F999|nr:hypothetical protein [Phaeobacter sp. 22II1-1F12B]OWU75270.1 hypothetical protein ATO1_18995 [Phaeobacter sp. 22II1-1F12B]